MHGDLAGEFQVVNPTVQIIAGGAQIAQLLRDFDLIIFWRFANGGFFRGDIIRIKIFDLSLTRRDIKGEFIIEIQCLGIEHIQRFDVFEQGMFVGKQAVGDLVNLALNRLKPGHEFCKGGRAAKQAFPPAGFAAHVEFGDGKAPNG